MPPNFERTQRRLATAPRLDKFKNIAIIASNQFNIRMNGRVVEGDGLENRCRILLPGVRVPLHPV